MSDPTAAAGGAAAGQDVSEYITGPEHEPAREDKPRSLMSDALHDLSRRPLFIGSAAIIVFLIVVAIFPTLLTSVDPRDQDLQRSRIPANADFLGIAIAMVASVLATTSAVMAVLGRRREGIARSFVGVFAGFGAAFFAFSSLIVDNTLYLVFALVAAAVTVAVSVSALKKRVMAGPGILAVAAIVGVIGVIGLVLTIGDLSTVSHVAPFGYDQQGRDIYAGIVYGTRWTLLVGLMATALTVVLGGFVGILAGYFGGWIDSLLSRVGEVFFGLPFILGAIVILSVARDKASEPGWEWLNHAMGIVATVVLSIAILSWPISMRIMRAATISAKQQDYVKAARALGAKPVRIIFRHLLPNAVAPVLVYATIALGAFIGAEATLSFLGIGLRDPAVSWGAMIADARQYIRASPMLLVFPASFLTATVLAFVMLGDAVREALDPKMK